MDPNFDHEMCLSLHTPLGMIPVAGKLGSYSNVQYKTYKGYRVEIFAPSIFGILVPATLTQ